MISKNIWLLWLIAIVLALVAVMLYQVGRVQARTPDELECRSGVLSEHRNFESVFWHFPDRLAPDVHGYVATYDCAEIGERYTLAIGAQYYSVVVADCLNADHQDEHQTLWRGRWLADVDEFLYSAARIKQNGNIGSLCINPP